ncbi:MAG: fibronectin type III domain-containing protein, partial [Granulosicoccus sp.]|nr:fibronectin type III domain-containing protein [Granulosicoccus sp.]
MNHRLLVVAVSVFVASCTGGSGTDDISFDDDPPPITDSPGITGVTDPANADGAISSPAASEAVNDPTNSDSEPEARPWVGTTSNRQARCGGLVQGVDLAFATSAFLSVEDAQGRYLLATSSELPDTAEFIEFCVNVQEPARYRIATQVRAPSISEDSYYFTINEDVPDTIPEPGIYDVRRSNSFIDDVVNTRTENPLIVTLEPGAATLRFYLREANVALRQISLEIDSLLPADPVDPTSDALALCAANTGMAEDTIDNLINQYLGNVERRFVLAPADEERGPFVRNDYRWNTAQGSGNIMCLAAPPPGGTNLIDNTVTENRIVFGSQGADHQRAATPLRGTFIGNGGDDEIGVLDGGFFDGGDGNDFVRLIRSGQFVGGLADDRVGVMREGSVNGGSGNDSITTVFGGVYDGGPDFDRVTRRAALAQTANVEDPGVLFEPLLPPSNLVFADSTPSSTLVRWSASADVRIQGYVVEQRADTTSDVVAELGEPPNVISPWRTATTEFAIDRLRANETLINVRAFTELADGSFLYSDALEAEYEPPQNQSGDVIAMEEFFDFQNLSSATLSDNG